MCVYVCVFISFHRKGYSWLNKAINVVPEFKSAMDGMLWKYFCIKDLRVKDIHKNNLQAGSCANECK